MPIYEYECGDCGFQKEILQKVSDEPISQCPDCGKYHFIKKVSAAGFKLKGTGWYETDFKDKKPVDKSSGEAGPGTSTSLGKESGSKDAPASTSKSSDKEGKASSAAT